MDWDRKLTGFSRDLLFYLRHRDDPDARRFFADRTKSFLLRRIEYVVMGRSLDDPIPILSNPLGIEIRPGMRGDLPALAKRIFPSEIDRYRRRLENGREFYLSFLDGHWINYAWTTHRLRFAVDNLRLELREGDIYIDDAHTVPELRGRGINTLLHHFILAEYRKRGFRRAVVIVDVQNAPSLRAMEKCGFHPIGRFLHRRFLFSRRQVPRRAVAAHKDL